MNNIHHSLESLAIDIDKLTFLEGNPRKGDIEAVAKSYKQFGQRKPIVATKDYVVIAGNHQLAAARQLGWDRIAVVITDDDELTAKAFALADNRTAELGSYDDDLLADLLSEVSSVPELMDSTGFTEDDLFDLIGFDDEPEDEQEIEVPVEPKTKLGDMYKLGNHYLLCGDSSNIKNIKKLLKNHKATMIFTDPPYDYKEIKGAGIFKEQVMKVAKDIEFISKFSPENWLETTNLYFDSNYSAYIFCNKDLVPNYLNWAIEKKLNFNILSWHKKTYIPLGGKHHYPDTEYCIFISKNPVFNMGLSSEHYKKYWIEDKDKNINHPTAKPLAIIKLCINLNSKVNDIVIDCFGGSGSTLIASELLKRKCYMMELDPAYCDVIIERWENLTGQKAELIEKGQDET